MKRLGLDDIEPHASIHIKLIFLIEQAHILFPGVYFIVKDAYFTRSAMPCPFLQVHVPQCHLIRLAAMNEYLSLAKDFYIVFRRDIWPVGRIEPCIQPIFKSE